jgi:hypothetical protein
MCGSDSQEVDGQCPAGRECYSFQQYCFDATTVCMLPQGVHCSDLSCNPGDTPTTSDDQDCWAPSNACYTKQLCAQSVWCKYGADAGVSEAGVDSCAPETGIDAEALPHCGDGTVDTGLGEFCDLGNLNGQCLGAQLNPVSPASAGCQQWCTTNCQLPLCFALIRHRQAFRPTSSNAVARGQKTHDSSHRSPHSTDAGPSAHHGGIMSNSSQGSACLKCTLTSMVCDAS